MHNVQPDEVDDFREVWKIGLRHVADEQIEKAMQHILEGKTEHNTFPPTVGAFKQLCENFKIEKPIADKLVGLPDYTNDEDKRKAVGRGELRKMYEILGKKYPRELLEQERPKKPENHRQKQNRDWWANLAPEAKARLFADALVMFPALKFHMEHLRPVGEPIHYLDHTWPDHFSFGIFMELVGRPYREMTYA